MDTILEARAPDNGAIAYQISSERKKLGVWLDDLVSKSQAKPSARVISLTPALAEVLLDRNPANRKINFRAVETYTHEIRGNRWSFNGEPIIVANTGELNDGQHRCMAVIEAGKAIDVLLIVGVDRETRVTLDQGRARTAADYLSMSGNLNTMQLASAANYLWQYRNRGLVYSGGARGGAVATKGEIMDVVAANPGLERSLALVQVKGADAVGGRAILAFVHFVFSTVNREDADFFIHQLTTGAGLRAGDAILYVRNRIINGRGALKKGEKIELLFKGWNAWRKRESVNHMKIIGGVLPVLER